MEIFFAWKSHLQNEDQKLFDLMKSLEIFTGQEIQVSQKAMAKRFKITEESIRSDKQGEAVQAKDLASAVPLRVRGYLPRVLVNYSIIASEKPENTQYPNGYKECKWKPIGKKDREEIKQAIVSYGLH